MLRSFLARRFALPVSLFALALFVFAIGPSEIANADAVALPAPFQFATANDALTASFPDYSSKTGTTMLHRWHGQKSTVPNHVRIEEVADWKTGGAHVLLALIAVDPPTGGGGDWNLDVAVFRAVGNHLALVARDENALYAEERRPRFSFDLANYTLHPKRRTFGIRQLTYTRSAVEEVLDLFRLHGRSVDDVGQFLMFGRTYATRPNEGITAVLETVPRSPYADMRLVTREIVCYGYRTPFDACKPRRGVAPTTELYRFATTCSAHDRCPSYNNSYGVVADESTLPTVPFHYTASDLATLERSPVPVLAPARIPADALGEVPTVRLYHGPGEPASYLIVLGYGANCDADVCMDGSVEGKRGSIVPCDLRHPRDGIDGIYDMCDRKAIRLRNGALAWYRRYHCGSSCDYADALMLGPGTVYHLNIKHVSDVDAYTNLANSLRPLSGLRSP